MNVEKTLFKDLFFFRREDHAPELSGEPVSSKISSLRDFPQPEKKLFYQIERNWINQINESFSKALFEVFFSKRYHSNKF